MVTALGRGGMLTQSDIGCGKNGDEYDKDERKGVGEPERFSV